MPAPILLRALTAEEQDSVAELARSRTAPARQTKLVSAAGNHARRERRMRSLVVSRYKCDRMGSARRTTLSQPIWQSGALPRVAHRPGPRAAVPSPREAAEGTHRRPEPAGAQGPPGSGPL